MSGGFFRGTSADQDTRFSNKQAKLLKTQKFAPELEHLVDMTKVKMDVMRPWIATRVTELLGFEDEVLINFIYGLLDGKEVNGKEVQISLTGFMEKNTGKFMKELWSLLLSAQKNDSGVPQQFLDAKEEELRKKQAEKDRMAIEIQKKKDSREVEWERQKSMDGGVETKANNAAMEPASKHVLPKGSSVHVEDEIDIKKRNGVRGRNRVSRSPHTADGSPSSPRDRQKSRSLSRSPEARGRSISSDRVRRSPRRRSITPRRRRLPQDSLSPLRRRSYSSTRSRSSSRHKSPSPVRRRSPSPIRRRSPSPVRRRRSPSPIRRRRSPSPARRRRSPSPVRRRRSPSPARRRRSPSPARRRRSPSPFRRRRTPSPARRRRSPSPARRHRSPSPARHRRSPFPSRRPRSPLPVGRRSPSPMRRRSLLSVGRRSPSPLNRRNQISSSTPRRRSSSPSRRSSSPVSKQPVSPAVRRSNSPYESSSPPVRRRSPSPPRRRFLSGDRGSPAQFPRGRVRVQGSFSPMRRRHSSSSRSPPRYPKDRKDSRNKVPSPSPSPDRSPVSSPSPPLMHNRIAREDRRSSSPSDSPVRQKSGRSMGDGNSSSPQKPTELKARHGSPETSIEDEEIDHAREGGDYKSRSLQKRAIDSSAIVKRKDSPSNIQYKDEHTPGRSGRRATESRGRPDAMESRNKDQELEREKSSGRMLYPEIPGGQKTQSSKDALWGQRQRASYTEGQKSDDRNGSRFDNNNVSDRRHKSESASRLVEKVDHDNGDASVNSGSEESGKHRTKSKEKRKHKRSRRLEVASDDDYSNDSEIEDRKQAKKRRKEEKKLRKEERRRRREERRRKKEERRAEKQKLKDHKDVDSSDDEHAGRKNSYPSDEEEMQSDQKKLEIELRKKALESLNAKKGIGH